MNINQAEAIYRLSSSKDWPILIDVLREKIDKKHLDLEWMEDPKAIQGAIKELRTIINIDKKAESVIATGKAR
jgi:hypothetical protein